MHTRVFNWSTTCAWWLLWLPFLCKQGLSIPKPVGQTEWVCWLMLSHCMQNYQLVKQYSKLDEDIELWLWHWMQKYVLNQLINSMTYRMRILRYVIQPSDANNNIKSAPNWMQKLSVGCFLSDVSTNIQTIQEFVKINNHYANKHVTKQISDTTCPTEPGCWVIVFPLDVTKNHRTVKLFVYVKLNEYVDECGCHWVQTAIFIQQSSMPNWMQLDANKHYEYVKCLWSLAVRVKQNTQH